MIAAATWPLGGWLAEAHAQSKQKPVVIGWLHTGTREAGANSFAAFKKGLAALGLKEGSNIVIEARWADGHFERLPVLAGELAAKKPAVLVATSAAVAIRMAEAAPNIPIVQASGANPVQTRLAKSLARPGGMVTGITNLSTELSEKLVEMLVAVAPKVRRVGFLLDGNSRNPSVWLEPARRSAAQYAVEAHFAQPATAEDIEPAVSALAKQGVQALISIPSPFLGSQRTLIIKYAQAQQLPVVGSARVWAEHGALLSYGADTSANFRRAAYYVDRILKGTKPGDLPIEQPTKFELVINMKTAKALGIAIPQAMILRATAVIE
ncbi:MAG: ABC transporter substrate-binding protein [Betaproteobacteria bacterium]|nr:ABC transporter substrate-binding protein [Betaproteobacteria bacterium]